MGYKAKSWRDSQGEPRDPFGDTHPNILKLAKEMRQSKDSGEMPNLVHVLDRITDSLANLSAKFEVDKAKVAGHLDRLHDRIVLLLWAAGIIFVAMVGALFKALHL